MCYRAESKVHVFDGRGQPLLTLEAQGEHVIACAGVDCSTSPPVELSARIDDGLQLEKALLALNLVKDPELALELDEGNLGEVVQAACVGTGYAEEGECEYLTGWCTNKDGTTEHCYQEVCKDENGLKCRSSRVRAFGESDPWGPNTLADRQEPAVNHERSLRRGHAALAEAIESMPSPMPNRREFLSAMSLLGLGTAFAPRVAAGQPAAPLRAAKEVKTGGARRVEIHGGKYSVWTKRVGRGGPKVLTLHGGPGATHEYLECFEDFLPPHGIELYHYDQLGSGFSDQPKDPSLWTIDRFRDEVEDVRAGLGLDSFYLYGHSWGAQLAIEYALAHPRHLKGLVLSNMSASIASYVRSANAARKKLPVKSQKVLAKYEAVGDYTAPEYEAVMFGEVYRKHFCRLWPWPEPVTRTFGHVNAEVYNTMQGPNELVITGNFKDWDRWRDLSSIAMPTLVIGAKWDTMAVEDIKKMGKLIPRARTSIMANGSHLCMYDDQDAYFAALLTFIDDVEAGKLG